MDPDNLLLPLGRGVWPLGGAWLLVLAGLWEEVF